MYPKKSRILLALVFILRMISIDSAMLDTPIDEATPSNIFSYEKDPSNTGEEDVSHASLRGAGVDDETLQSVRELSFWSAIGDWFTGCPDGNKDDVCSAGCPCSGSNTCEAWSHVCRAPGKAEDPCHATRPCGSGLNCQPGVHQCYNVPRLEGQPCVAGYGCAPGLNCEAGAQVCRKPGTHGDHCHWTRPCASGYWCVDAISSWNYQQCIPDCTSFESDVVEQIKNKGYLGNDGDFDEKWLGGVVPFQADCGLETNELALFSRAMKHIEEKTIVRFERYDPSKHKNWVILADYDENAANSYVGRMKEKGWQRINLDTDWGPNGAHDLGSAIHEIVHALGWKHTQARPDRDSYVTINRNNIEVGMESNFDTAESSVYKAVQKCREYDYGSIMHYSKSAFSVNRGNTITTKDTSKQDVIGNRSGLTTQDASEINDYYNGLHICMVPTWSWSCFCFIWT